jgi:hypothetical protein
MEKAVLFSDDIRVFANEIHRVRDRNEYKHADRLPYQCVQILRRIPGRNVVRQHEAGGN